LQVNRAIYVLGEGTVKKDKARVNGSVQSVLKGQHPNLPAVIINANQTTTTKKREKISHCLLL